MRWDEMSFDDRPLFGNAQRMVERSSALAARIFTFFVMAAMAALGR